MVLMTLTACMQPMINVICKSILPHNWGRLLRIVEEVRTGKRPEHTRATESQKDLYDWVQAPIEKLD